MNASTLDSTFAALADPTRRAILARLALGETTVMELAKPFEMTQPAVSRHLKVLEEAGLIVRRVDGSKRPARLAPSGIEAIDQWLEMRWDPPASMYLEVAVSKAGETREKGYAMPGVHILTPETDHSTLYFWAGSLRVEDQVPLDEFRESFIQTFEHEDKPMLEQVAAGMDGETDLLAMKPLLLRSDAGSVLARRVLAELIAMEQG